MRLQPTIRFARLPLLALAAVALASCEIATDPEDETVPMVLVAADRDGHIYLVNESTGEETLILPTVLVGGPEEAEIGVVSSMVWVPATEAWWLGTGGNAECYACILSLDPNTGDATVLFDLSEDLYAIPGMAVDPEGDRVYTFEADGGGYLYEINIETGDLDTLIDDMNEGGSGKGTTFGEDGHLYVAGDDELTRIDIEELTHTLVDSFTFEGFPAFDDPNPSIGSMATRSDGTVFAILKDGGGGGVSTTYLVTVDLATAEVTNVGVNTHLLDGLAYVPVSLIE